MNQHTIQKLDNDIRKLEDLRDHLVWEFRYYRGRMKQAAKEKDMEAKKKYYDLKTCASQQRAEVKKELNSLYQVGDC